jgi:hypothetical protein
MATDGLRHFRRSGPARAGLLALFLLARPGPAPGADAPPAGAASASASAPAPRKVATRPWFAVPAGARTAIWRMARREGVTPTTYDIFEQDGHYLYEFHASRRSGLFGRERVVLCSMTEPVASVAAREEARSLRGRLTRLGERLKGADSPVP